MSDLLRKSIDFYCTQANKNKLSNQEIIIDSMFVMSYISKLGEIFLKHYLFGSSENLIIPTGGIIENDLTIKTNIKNNLVKYITNKTTENISNGQHLYSNRNFQLAFGSLNFQWKVVETFNTTSSQSYVVDIWFINKYRWHEKAARVSQCMHRAFSESIGKQYDMIGKRVFYLLDIDAKGASDLTYLDQNRLTNLRHKNMPSAHTGKDIEIIYPETRIFFGINNNGLVKTNHSSQFESH